MKQLFFALGALCLPVLVACSSGPSGTSKSAAADSIAHEGENCGGFVANAKQCDESENLYCKAAAHCCDMPGTCTSCSTFGPLPRFAKTCDDGTTDSPHWIAQNGTCVMQVCGVVDNGSGSSGGGGQPTCLTLTCESGYTCQTQDDGSGQCVPAGGSGAVGDHCQADSDCSQGLSCVQVGSNLSVCQSGQSNCEVEEGGACISSDDCGAAGGTPSGNDCDGNGNVGCCDIPSGN